jgi:hypothetical protein
MVDATSQAPYWLVLTSLERLGETRSPNQNPLIARGECSMQPFIYLIMFLVMLGCGSTQQVGRSAAKGALDAVKEQSRAPEHGPPPLEDVARNIIRGALNELDTARSQAQLGRVAASTTRGAVGPFVGPLPGLGWGGGPVSGRSSNGGVPMASMVSEGFTLGLSRELQAQLGPDGEGPLAKSLAGLTGQLSGAAATAVTQSLTTDLGDCAGADRARCADKRVQEMSRSAAVGFAHGIVDTINVVLLAAAFACGIVAALLFFFAVRLTRRPADA